MKNSTIPCTHPEVVAVRKWNHQRLEHMYRCTSCHEQVPATREAA